MTKNAKAKEFWKELVYTEDKLDEEKVLNELSDYLFLLDNVPEVYCTITGGLLSKPNYDSSTVLREYERVIREEYVHKDDLRMLLE